MNCYVELTWSEVLLGAQVGVQRQVQNLRLKRRNAHGASVEDPWRLNINGALGELAVAKYLGRYWEGMGALGDLKAPDVAGGIQVRWRSSESYDLIVQPKDPDDNPVVLVTGTTPLYRLHGWILGRDARRDEWWKDPAGNRPAWFVPQNALRSMDELKLEHVVAAAVA